MDGSPLRTTRSADLPTATSPAVRLAVESSGGRRRERGQDATKGSSGLPHQLVLVGGIVLDRAEVGSEKNGAPRARATPVVALPRCRRARRVRRCGRAASCSAKPSASESASLSLLASHPRRRCSTVPSAGLVGDEIDAGFKRRDDVGGRVGMGENRFGGAMCFFDAGAYRVRRELSGSWCREKELQRVHALREQLL